MTSPRARLSTSPRAPGPMMGAFLDLLGITPKRPSTRKTSRSRTPRTEAGRRRPSRDYPPNVALHRQARLAGPSRRGRAGGPKETIPNVNSQLQSETPLSWELDVGVADRVSVGSDPRLSELRSPRRRAARSSASAVMNPWRLVCVIPAKTMRSAPATATRAKGIERGIEWRSRARNGSLVPTRLRRDQRAVSAIRGADAPRPPRAEEACAPSSMAAREEGEMTARPG